MLRSYVQCQDPAVNNLIDSQLRRIAETIVRNVPGVVSIIVAGGFGKGEGSVRLTEDQKIKCLRDFDIVCIVEHKPDSQTSERLHDQVYRSLGLRNPEFSLFRSESFTIDLKFLRKDDLIYPDIYFYDLKAASQILWGEDVRSLVPWTNKDVPWSSGLRVLFEKVIGLLGHFSIAYMEGKNPECEEKDLLVSECRKTFIEICTALCILAGKYEPKFADRANALRDFYSSEFPSLAQVLPELPRRVTEYTNHRLDLHRLETNEDPVDLWFSAQSYLKTVLAFYLKSRCQQPMTDWSDLPSLIKTIALDYYKPFLGPLLKNRLNLSSKSTLALLSPIYQGLTNIEYVHVLASNRKRIYLRPLLSCTISPSLKYFSAAAMLLFSLEREGTVKAGLLRNAKNQLRSCVPARISSLDATGWEELRCQCLKAHGLYRGYHLVK